MQFSSKPPFNDDPEPWARFPDKGAGGVRSPKNPKGYLYWNPRPEFDRPQHNPTNPILVARRNNPGKNLYYRDLERWPTDAEINHARRVLTRLANLTKEESR